MRCVPPPARLGPSLRPDPGGSNPIILLLVEQYGEPRHKEARCSRASGLVQSDPNLGSPDSEDISTSQVEARQPVHTDGSASVQSPHKRVPQEVQQPWRGRALYLMYYNFCRVHKTLGVTPALEIGLPDYVWELDELVALLEI